MAVSVNLSRNTKVYFTTNQDITGYGDHNTAEIQVLGGYTFSQGTDQQTIQIMEAGATPNRGQRSFNTKLNPVDWKFTTYVRPRYLPTAAESLTATSATCTLVTVANVVTNAYVTATSTAGTWTKSQFFKIAGFTTQTWANSATVIPVHRVSATVCRWAVPLVSATAGTVTGSGTFTSVIVNTAPEAYMWNALTSNKDLFAASAGAAWTHGTSNGTATTACAQMPATQSNVHQLAPFALIFKIDNVYYKVKGSAVNSADVNFGIDQIAQVAWAGYGTAYETVSAAGIAEITALQAYDSTAGFITNKLSIVSLGLSAGSAFTQTTGVVGSATKYNVPITGGTVSINNNLTYLTPEVVGVVNTPIGYFTGTRAVTGNLTAYLRTGGSTETSDLLTALLTGAATSSENLYSAILNMGGAGATVPHVEFMFDGAMLQIPSVDVQDVVSTTINFTGQGTTANAYDITNPNEFQIRYLAA